MDDPAVFIRYQRCRPLCLAAIRAQAARIPPAAFLVAALCIGAWALGVPWMAYGAEPASNPGPKAQPDPLAAPPPKGFDQPQVLRRCLVFTVKGIRDRQADVDHEDWVVLALDNRCGTAIFNLQVELVLVDTRGRPYGKTFWVLGKGDGLDPGAKWEDSVAVPDPDSRVPRAWTLRVLRADMLGKPRGPAPSKPPRDWR